ncbi:MAG TPA: hypothetical protein VGC91_01805 [Pyrinomonadaceae bacterium]
MAFKTILHTLALIMLLFVGATAQEIAPVDKSKDEQQKAQAELEKKALALLEETLDGAQLLKLPENRSYIFYTAADLLWKHDEKRARGFFQDSLNALADAIKSVSASEFARDPSGWMLMRQRQEILTTVARHDPQFALDLLRATRQVFTENTPSYGRYMDQELELEQSIAAEVAAKDPKKALQMAEESLAKGVSYETMSLLRQLQMKDGEAAKSFAGDLVKKLSTTDFTKNPQAAYVAQELLHSQIQSNGNGLALGNQSAPKVKPLVLDEQTKNELTDIIINAAMNSTPGQPVFMMMQSLLPELEKRAPERVAQLRRKLAENNDKLDPMFKMAMQYQSLMMDGKPEEILAAAAKAPPDMRGWLYQAAIRKLIQSGDLERARQIISDNLTGAERDNWLAQIDKQLIARALKENKLDEARKLLERINPKEARLAQIAVMATDLFEKGDRKLALALLDETQELVNRAPESQGEINAMMQVARAYAVIDPARAYGIIEPVLDQANALLAAAALLEKFGADRGLFKDGEYRLSVSMGYSYSLATQYRKEINALARTDFARTRALADRLQRDEARLMARLLIAQAVLAERPESENGSGVGIGGSQ